MTTPSWVWAKSAGSTQLDYAGLDYGSSTISTNQFGHSYITGRFGGPAQFGGITLSANSYPAIFVAKYNANGACMWARKFGGDDPDIYGNKGEAIAIDSAQRCYVTGTFHGSAGSTITVVPNVTLTGTGQRQIFVVKCNPGGSALWARQPVGVANVNNYAKGIAADFLGNSYITGYLGGNGVQFGTTTLSGPGAYVVKYDTQGAVVWATKIGSSGGTDGASIAVDPGGRSYVTGYLQGTETFVTTGGGTTLTSIGSRDVFLAAVNPAGGLLWVKQFGFASNTAYGRGVSTDAYGDVFITGDFDTKVVFGATTLTTSGPGTTEAFVAKLNINGIVLWAKQSTNSQASQGNSVKALPTGACLVAGHYLGGGAVGFGNNVLLTSTGMRRTFVVKYDVGGATVWGQNSNGANTGESPMGVSHDALQNVYIAGNVQGAAQFGPHTVVAHGGYDAFIAKLEAVCP